MSDVSNLILKNLVQNEDYLRAVLPYLRQEYFGLTSEKAIVLDEIAKHTTKYNIPPTRAALEVAIQKRDNINETAFQIIANELLPQIYDDTAPDDFKWLVDTTESFCQEKAIYNAIKSSIDIMDGKGKLTKQAIPKLLQDALAISFDSSIGHDFIDDANARYDYYHRKEDKIEFGIELLNKITRGGLTKKTLTCFVAPTGVGKTMVMCDGAANNLIMGKNVLYITLEMAEERIAERIDANLLDVGMDNLALLTRDKYFEKITKIKKKITGKLIIKEYPPTTVGAHHFRYLVEELRIKKGFVPDVIYIDYLNLCASSRIKSSENTYVLIKSIAEEVRGLAVEKDCVIVTATQTNRSGQNASDFDLGEVAESHGLSATCDLMIGIISTEELEEQRHLRFKQLKNRYAPLNENRSFLVGVDRSKMRLYDVKAAIEANIQQKPYSAPSEPPVASDDYPIEEESPPWDIKKTVVDPNFDLMAPQSANPRINSTGFQV